VTAAARRRVTARSVLAEAGVLGAAALDSLLEVTSSDGIWPWIAGGLALAGLLVRRRRPGLGFLATLPGLVTSFALIATLVALYTLARRSESRRVVGAAVAVTVIGFVVKLPVDGESFLDRDTLLDLVYGVLQGAVPAALGQLVRARETLRCLDSRTQPVPPRPAGNSPLELIEALGEVVALDGVLGQE
jgi:hypothetical protein